MLIYSGANFLDDWAARGRAAEKYLRTRPWTPRRAFFESIVRASRRMAGPVQAPFSATPPTEGGTPGAGRATHLEFTELRSAAA